MESPQTQSQSPQTYSPKPALSPTTNPPKTSSSQADSSEPKKRRISTANVIVFIILLIILGIIALFFLSDESKVGECGTAGECEVFNVFYIKGNGYLCANSDVVSGGSFKTKLLMFKYASKKALKSEPTGCLCSSSQCEVDLD